MPEETRSTPGRAVAVKRLILFAAGDPRTLQSRALRHTLAGLKGAADRVVLVHGDELDAQTAQDLEAVDATFQTSSAEFSPRWYEEALRGPGDVVQDVDEVVFTGDAVLGPVGDLTAVLERASGAQWDLWQMVENRGGLPEAFAPQGFPHRTLPWAWTALGRRLIESRAWAEYWAQARTPEQELTQEIEFVHHFAQRGFTSGFAFEAARFPSSNPALHHSELLLDAGCPFVSRAVFQSYPPFLDRQAILGREIVEAMTAHGYPADLVWDALVRSTPPKTLNTNASMLEVIDGQYAQYDEARPFRIAVVARVTAFEDFDELLRRIGYLPEPLDVYITTTDGRSAARIERRLEAEIEPRLGRLEVRVTPANRGRDMSDFFVGCRDVLRSGRYDLVVKLHARRERRKTVNRRRYFRRYQLENLLDSPEHARSVLALFQAEPGLGAVFPPMMHIGYATMGRGWAELRPGAEKACEMLGITVPLDNVSPLAPYGGMWIARPEALRSISDHPWTFSDYGSKKHGKLGRLAHLQERLIAPAAAQRGFHVRTVLTPEHAAISHTALEFKADELFSTTRGYPVEQIQLLQRAGFTGYGGIVAIARMYLRVNHPRIVGFLRPLYSFAYRAYGLLSAARHAIRGRDEQEKVR